MNMGRYLIGAGHHVESMNVKPCYAFYRVKQVLFSTTNPKAHREPAEIRGLPVAESETVGKLGLTTVVSQNGR
jgi:hypothetical protein